MWLSFRCQYHAIVSIMQHIHHVAVLAVPPNGFDTHYGSSSLVPYLRKKYETSGQNIFKGDNAFFVLSGVLEDMIRVINGSRVYIAIGALDECERELDKLFTFIARNSALFYVRWLVSSLNTLGIE
ncbi:hypothetical protein F4814DRAFT_243765 [Daldinia grandis]|nr:hypothetical protein F4814DRAFT_243765 [Daldinia grandis]